MGNALTYILEDNWYMVQVFWPFPVDAPDDFAYLYLWIQAEIGPPKRIIQVTTECPFSDPSRIRVARFPEPMSDAKMSPSLEQPSQ